MKLEEGITFPKAFQSSLLSLEASKLSDDMAQAMGSYDSDNNRVTMGDRNDLKGTLEDIGASCRVSPKVPCPLNLETSNHRTSRTNVFHLHVDPSEESIEGIDSIEGHLLPVIPEFNEGSSNQPSLDLEDVDIGFEPHDLKSDLKGSIGSKNKRKKKRTNMQSPPDGGWGWMVVFASFMIHLISDGVMYTFGIFYVELVRYFAGGKGITALVPSIMTGMTFAIGPVASGLTNKFGCRAITILGSILASFGLIISVFCTSVYQLIFTIGICTGAGFGLIYLPAIVSVTSYFEKKRAFATGIAVCGSGIGSTIFAPLTDYLINTFGWRGAMIIVSALVLNCCVFGCLLRPLEDTEDEEDDGGDGDDVFGADVDVVPTLRVKPNDSGKKHSIDSSMSRPYDHRKRHKHSLLPLPIKPLAATASCREFHELMPSEPESPTRHSFCDFKVKQDTHYDLEGVNKPLMVGNRKVERKRKHSTISHGFLSRKDIFYSRSIQHLPQCSSNPVLSSSNATDHGHRDQNAPHNGNGGDRPKSWFIPSQGDLHHLSSMNPSLQVIEEVDMNPDMINGHDAYDGDVESVGSDSDVSSPCCWFCPQEIVEAAKLMMDFEILCNPIFLLFSVSNLITSFGYYVPHIYLTDKALLTLGSDRVTKTEASNLIGIIGIGSTIGRLLFGYMSDHSFINRSWLYNGCLTICGISLMMAGYTETYMGLSVHSVIIGITCGAYVSLTSVILVDLLGLEKLTNAFGILLLFQGVGCLIGPPVVGWMFDVTGSYNTGFALSGALISFSGLILFVIPYMKGTDHPSSPSPSPLPLTPPPSSTEAA